MQKTLAIAVVGLLCCLASMQGLLASSVAPLSLQSGTTLYVGGSGPGNYTTIQDAINASVDGNTIFIYEKTPCYRENIMINKSISLIGENQNVSIDTRNWSIYIIRIVRDSVRINGIKLDVDGNLGINVENSSFVNITHCHFWNDGNSILFKNVKNSSIFHNYFDYIEGCYTGAVVLSASDGNIFQDNLIIVNHFSVDLVISDGSRNNLVQNNNFPWPIHPGDTRSIVVNFNAGTGNKIIHNNIYPEIVCNVKAYWQRNYYEGAFRYWGPYPPKEVNYRILSLFLPMVLWNHNLRNPIFNVDWRPAFKPYNFPQP